MTFEKLLQLDNIPDIEALSDEEIEKILAPVLARTKLPEDFNPIEKMLAPKEKVKKLPGESKKKSRAEMLEMINAEMAKLGIDQEEEEE